MSTKTALITGASAGIGEELARLFAKDGHNLILVARRLEKLQSLADSLKEKYQIEAHVISADLSEPHIALSIHEQVGEAGLQVDFLVNNAGFGTTGKFWELDAAVEANQVQVNVTALVELTRGFLPAMVERGEGRVLNIASTAGFQSGPYMATYYATKAFVVSFTDAIAFELRGTGVTATAHCPGATESEFSAVARIDGNKLFTKGGVASTAPVAKHAYEAMHRGHAISIHGVMNSAMAFSVRFSPRNLVNVITAKLNRP